MRKIKEMLRLHYEMGLGKRAIARSLGVSHSPVSDLLNRARALGCAWPLSEGLDEAALEAALYPGNTGLSRQRAEPDWDQVHRELRRKGVTLQLLWLKYREQNPGATSTPSSASTTGAGAGSSISSCGRGTGRARKC